MMGMMRMMGDEEIDGNDRGDRDDGDNEGDGDDGGNR